MNEEPINMTCPSRFQLGARDKIENIDCWQYRGEKIAAFDNRYCSYCGSLHPDVFISLAQKGNEITPTDKNYKAYVEGGGKFYFWHMDPSHVLAFMRLHRTGRLKIAYPHLFYKMPYVWTRENAPPLSFSAIVKPIGDVTDGTVISLLVPAYAKFLALLRKDPSIIYQIEPRVWEEIIAAAYEKEGYDEVILTPRSGDNGRDVIAIRKGIGCVRFIEQVKAYKPGHIVSADEVRALLGVLSGEMNTSKGIFTTTSAFAPGIRNDRFIAPFLPYRLELVDRDELIKRLLQD